MCNTLVAVRVSYAQKRFSTGLAERKRGACVVVVVVVVLPMLLLLLQCTGCACISGAPVPPVPPFPLTRSRAPCTHAKPDMWLAAVYEFVGIILLAAPVRALDAWTERRMAAVWRASLSQAFITAYCSQRAYFNLQLARGTEGEQPAEASPGRPQQLGPARAQPQLLGAMAGAAGGGAGGKGAAAAAALDATAAAAAAAQEELVAGFSEAAGGIDNPDQRMTADCASFVSTSVRLALLLLKKLLHCVAFAGAIGSCASATTLLLSMLLLLMCTCCRQPCMCMCMPALHPVLSLQACCTASRRAWCFFCWSTPLPARLARQPSLAGPSRACSSRCVCGHVPWPPWQPPAQHTGSKGSRLAATVL